MYKKKEKREKRKKAPSWKEGEQGKKSREKSESKLEKDVVTASRNTAVSKLAFYMTSPSLSLFPNPTEGKRYVE